MAYIPVDAKWYLAETVLEFTIEGERENIVHINWLLIRADSPIQAYERAIDLGAAGSNSYMNPDGKRVTAVFRGLKDLNVIHGELEHGVELTYEERRGLTASDLARLVSTKQELAVFRPAEMGPA